ncbi:MAG TPA: nuclear transport factor 2 family protein [Chitinophagaceae bacterium]|nr:nuclear transport factor 2 family protein [Chitinophagaceae bacterium]
MRKIVVIITLFVSVQSWAQPDKLVERMKHFHQLVVKNDFTLDKYIHEDLSYGHSNGWIENAKQFREDLGSIITYHSIKEDSISAVVSDKIAHIRFIADIDVTLRGVRSIFKLRVLEIWMKRKGNWVLFARQAIRYI